MSSSDKANLRLRFRAMRDAVSQQQKHRIEESLAPLLGHLAADGSVKTVAVYRPFGSELSFDFTDIFPYSQLALPVSLRGGVMEFIKVDCKAFDNSLPSIPEWLSKPWIALDSIPAHLEVVPTEAIDLAIVPGLVFSDDGVRLGYGGGYYDRYLARPEYRAQTAGVGYRACEGLILPSDDHDIRMDKVVLADFPR